VWKFSLPRAHGRWYVLIKLPEGLPKPPGRNGSKGAVGGHSLLIFFGFTITQSSPVGALHAVDVGAVVAARLGVTQSCVLPAAALPANQRESIMNRRTTLTLTSMALFFLAALLATAVPKVGLAQTNPLLGATWKLNLEKSKFNPGPAPRSSTLTYEAVGQGLRATNEGVDAQGNPTKGVFGPYFYDGKSYPVTGVPAYDATTNRIVNDSTVEMTRTKAGKVIQTTIRALSPDGKTLTFTTTGLNANGQQINDVGVYDKQ